MENGMNESWLKNFVSESNRIEGIVRKPTKLEIGAHAVFLSLATVDVAALNSFVAIVAPGKPLRTREGMNVRIGNHLPMEGGPWIEGNLAQILDLAHGGVFSPYEIHKKYETLHPFMDGNGRSGRVLWLWMMERLGVKHHRQIGFLHSWYYQSLSHPTPQ